jgi:hypothetical protein
MKKMCLPFILSMVLLAGCIGEGDKPYALSVGSFSLRKHDPQISCTIHEEGKKIPASSVCFSHDGYTEAKYENKEYESHEGGIHIWIRTYSEATEKMTADQNALDISKLDSLEVVEKCGSKLYAPDSELGYRFIWIKVIDEDGKQATYLAPESTRIRYKNTESTALKEGGMRLLEIEKITDIKVAIGAFGMQPGQG